MFLEEQLQISNTNISFSENVEDRFFFNIFVFFLQKIIIFKVLYLNENLKFCKNSLSKNHICISILLKYSKIFILKRFYRVHNTF